MVAAREHFCAKPCTAQRNPKAIKSISSWAGLPKQLVAQDEGSNLGCPGDHGNTSVGLH